MTGKSINTCTDLADQSDLSEPASAMQHCLVSGLQTDLQPAESSASRIDNVNESLHRTTSQACRRLTLIQLNNCWRSREVKPSKKQKQNEKNASIFFFLSRFSSYHAARPSRVSRPVWLSARTHSQLRLDRAFSVHGLIQANCAGDNRRRKKSEPGRAEILEPACASHRMTGALGMRPQQGSAVSSDNSSGYQKKGVLLSYGVQLTPLRGLF